MFAAAQIFATACRFASVVFFDAVQFFATAHRFAFAVCFAACAAVLIFFIKASHTQWNVTVNVS